MEILQLNEHNFDQVVFTSYKPVLVDFYADWCSPCKAFKIILDKFAELRSEVLIVKVNIDENHELARKYQISSIPTLMLVENGKVIKKEPGFKSKKALEDFLMN